MQEFVIKPIKLLGKQFLGTRDSAQELTEWFRNMPNSGYTSAEFKEFVRTDGFESNTRAQLSINTEHGGWTLRSGDWLVYYPETDDWSTYEHARLFQEFKQV